jgi:hypothetical protein
MKRSGPLVESTMAQQKKAAVLCTRHRDGAGSNVARGAAAWPVCGARTGRRSAQTHQVLLSARQGDREYEGYIAGFREALEMHGWSERRNFRIGSKSTLNAKC